MSTFKAINHSPSVPMSAGPSTVELMADLAPVNRNLERIAVAIETLCLKCDSEDIAEAITKIQLRVDIPEIRPMIDVKSPDVHVTLPEMKPTINLTAPEGSTPIVPTINLQAPGVVIRFPIWGIVLMAVMPAISFLVYFLLVLKGQHP